jgi:hypothetical protein
MADETSRKVTGSGSSKRRTAQAAGVRAGEPPKLLSGGNPQIPKGDGDAPVQAYIAAMPGWKGDVGRRLDALVERIVPDVRKAVRWNSPFYGMEGDGWFLSYHCFTKYVKVVFLRGSSLRPLPPIDSKRPEHAVLPHPRKRADRRGTPRQLDQAGVGAAGRSSVLSATHGFRFRGAAATPRPLAIAAVSSRLSVPASRPGEAATREARSVGSFRRKGHSGRSPVSASRRPALARVVTPGWRPVARGIASCAHDRAGPWQIAPGGETREGGQRGNETDRRAEAQKVGEHPGQQAPGHVPEVTPEPVHTHSTGAVAGRDEIAHLRDRRTAGRPRNLRRDMPIESRAHPSESDSPHANDDARNRNDS